MSFLTSRYFQILSRHDLYQSIHTSQDLRYFMERHVICTWSYNSLIKSLYQDIARVTLPLNSNVYKNALRLISQIVLGEEVEDLGDGFLVSHLELYLDAMQDVGCDTTPIFSFFDLIEKGMALPKAAKLSGFSPDLVPYLNCVIDSLKYPAHIKASLLYYEAEPFVPAQFFARLGQLSDQNNHLYCYEFFSRLAEGSREEIVSLAYALSEILCLSDAHLKAEADIACQRMLNQKIGMWNQIARSLGANAQAQPDISAPVVRQLATHLRLVT
jgi:hypothetical protein